MFGFPPGVRRVFRLPWRSARRIREDVDAEIEFHLDMRAAELVDEGMDPSEAHRRAEREFGDLERARRELSGADRSIERRARWADWLSDLRQDAGFAARDFRRHPGFVAVAVFTLALGIGGTTSLFGVLDALFLRPPAGLYEPDRLVRLYIVRNRGRVTTRDGGPGSYLDYRALRDGARGMVGVSATMYPREFDYGRGLEARRVRGVAVSGNYLSVLGVRPSLGRLLVPEDDRAGDARAVVVISHGFWQREFGADPDVLGRSILLEGDPHTIVGVAGPRFDGIDMEPADVWVPLATRIPGEDRPYSIFLRFVARLAPGADAEVLGSSAAAALAGAAESYPGLDPDPRVRVGPINAMRGPHRPRTARVALWIGVATGIVLLIACANIASVLLARVKRRRREVSVRLALGASRGRIARQFIAESVLLGLLGGLAGLLLAVAARGLIHQFPVPPDAGRIDLRYLGFVSAVSVLTGLLFGLAPAVDGATLRPTAGLKEGQPGARPSRSRLRAALVTGQVALSIIVLVAAGLFVRSLHSVLSADAGLDVDRLTVASVNLRSADYTAADRDAFYERAVDRLAALPSIAGAAAITPTPLSGSGWGKGIGGPGDTVRVNEGPYAYVVTPGYFRAAGIPILEGRAFGPADATGSEPVVMINLRLARALAGDRPVVGRCVPIGEQREAGGCTRVIGVAGDTRHRYLQEEPVPYIYFSSTQQPISGAPFPPAIVARVPGDPRAVVRPVRAAIQGMAPDLPYVDVRTLEGMLRPAVRPFRLGALLFTIFGLIAAVLSAVGLYGLIAQLVTERTHEMGVRKALGGGDSSIVRLVLGQGARPLIAGGLLGLCGALAGSHVLESLLHEIEPRDPLALLGALALVVAIGLLASWMPARRATRVDPAVALRSE